MAFNSNRFGSGMFDGIKSRLGIGNQGYDDYGYDDEYDDYDEEYDDYDEYDEDPDDGRYGRVVERDASSRRYAGSYSRNTPLVSIDDIRANSPKMTLDSTAESRSGGRIRQSYRSSDYMSSGSLEQESLPPRPPADSGSREEASRRSPGYDSLFSSTAGAADPSRSGVIARSDGVGTHRPTRAVVVIAPANYAEVEKVSNAMKNGDAVVLNMKSVSAELMKRVLDYSFGVAAALDGSVECIGPKVFALTRFTALSDAERLRLRSQGVVLE